uniref:radical SAM family heme chaperone HemW n=1 Tax=Candidatus Ventrenecus sp. TaxID=3085654 RepID=UPI003FEEEDB1
MSKSVYIHIPFCRNICSYCDFCKLLYKKDWADLYLNKLNEEILDRYLDDEIKTIYIGGGTPSCLSLSQIKKLLEICHNFHLSSQIEFTFECNLDDITEEILYLLKLNGVNRLSIGIQSFNEDNLYFLNRKHTLEEAEEKMALIRKLGFNNVNIDLMYALPTEDLSVLKKDLTMFLKLEPDHISTYSLMIEPHTMLYQKRIKPISEDMDSLMYKTIIKTLEKKDYHHYEVSNFAKEGYESKHNLTYWNNEEYYGFGLGASGYIDDIRYTNTKSLKNYLDGFYHGEQEILSLKDAMDNELMLGFRKCEGISLEKFKRKFGKNMEDCYPIKSLLKNKDLKEEDGYIFIPKDKFYIMNEILLKMI